MLPPKKFSSAWLLVATNPAYIRIIPETAGRACDVKFDLPYSDDEEWLGRDHGFSIVIDRNLAELVLGMEIHFDRSAFYSRPK